MVWRAVKICLIQIPKGAAMLIVTPYKMHLDVIYAKIGRASCRERVLVAV